MVCLTQDNLEELQYKGLGKLEGLHPAMFDAMKIVKSVEESYLWVDSLCIIQDNEDDKAMQIRQIGDIYTGALLTIIAAGRNSTRAGLRGLGSGTPPTNADVIRLGKIVLISTTEPVVIVDQCASRFTP